MWAAGRGLVAVWAAGSKLVGVKVSTVCLLHHPALTAPAKELVGEESKHNQKQKVAPSTALRVVVVRVVMVVVAMARAVVACGLQRVLNTTAAGENVWVLGVIVTFTSHVGAPQLDRVVQLCAALPLDIHAIRAHVAALHDSRLQI